MVNTNADLTINVAKEKRTLIVIDFLNSEDHPIIVNRVFERYCHACSFLVITNSDIVVKRVLQIKGLGDRKDEVTVQFKLFNRTEVCQFVHKSTGLELSDNQIDQFLYNTKGYPQFCQMICSIICSEHCDAREVTRLSESSLVLSQVTVGVDGMLFKE